MNKGFQKQTSAHSHQQGSTIIEAILITAVVGLVLVTIVSVLVLVVRNQRFSADQQTATRYAEEALEWLHKQRDQAGWEGFYDNIGAQTYCMASLPAALANLSTQDPCDPITANTTFTRTLQITPAAGPPQSATAVSTVTWTDNDKPYEVELTLILKQRQ